MALTLSDPSNFLKWVEYTLEIQKQLQDQDLDPTNKRVRDILSVVDENAEVLSGTTKEVIQLALHLYIAWLKETEVSLESQESMLSELEFLRNESDDVTMNRIRKFRNKLFPDMTATDIHTKISVPTRDIQTYFYPKQWQGMMSEELYEWCKYHIENNL